MCKDNPETSVIGLASGVKTTSAVDKIITSEKRLREISMPTTREEVELLDLVNRLKAACTTAWTPGMGLAAIQIGIPIRAAWFKWGEQDIVLINPKIVRLVSKVKTVTEGCLSIPNTWVKIRRHYKIKYENDGKLYTAKGDKAQVILHEVDHMDGMLITDKGKVIN